MLHNEARERLAEGYERKWNAAMKKKQWSIRAAGIQSGKAEAGSAALRTSQRGRKPKMSEKDLQRLKAQIEAHPDKTLGALKEELNLLCNESRLSRIVWEKLGSGVRRR